LEIDVTDGEMSGVTARIEEAIARCNMFPALPGESP
jgi:hypothetical protein